VKRAVRKKDGAEFAIKVIKKARLNEEELSVVHDEVEIMHRIQHPNCATLFEMFETPKKIYMVLELLSGGELFDRVVEKGSYSEKEASEVIRDVALAIKYIHEQGIVHRDLKPENLIYGTQADDSIIKITDFGLAKLVAPGEENTLVTACGTYRCLCFVCYNPALLHCSHDAFVVLLSSVSANLTLSVHVSVCRHAGLRCA
jgi:calcium/calmodulin-dependent protein kinase I